MKVNENQQKGYVDDDLQVQITTNSNFEKTKILA